MIRGVWSDGVPPLYKEFVTIPERGDVRGFVVLSRNYRLSFIPPSGWTVKFDTEKDTVTLLPPGLEAGITITVAAERSKESDDTPLNRLREQSREQYPDAMFTDEFTCYSGCGRGWAVDFECRIDKDAVRTKFRRAKFEFEEGTVESELRASSARFPEYHQTFGRVLNSLRVTFSEGRPHLALDRTGTNPVPRRRVDGADVWSD